MIDWYKKVVFENYANFSGRASRSEYWYFVLCNFLIIIGLMALALFSTYLLGSLGIAVFFLYFIYALIVFIPSLATVVRRLHDVNKSGWFYFVSLIPIVGGIWLLIILFTEGDRGENDYGEDPKQFYDETDEIGKIKA
jgi:uncharacterized membrane protein YhaH (DUF805 family)